MNLSWLSIQLKQGLVGLDKQWAMIWWWWHPNLTKITKILRTSCNVTMWWEWEVLVQHLNKSCHSELFIQLRQGLMSLVEDRVDTGISNSVCTKTISLGECSCSFRSVHVTELLSTLQTKSVTQQGDVTCNHLEGLGQKQVSQHVQQRTMSHHHPRQSPPLPAQQTRFASNQTHAEMQCNSKSPSPICKQTCLNFCTAGIRFGEPGWAMGW